ncbi:MAG: DUF4097 family beta strand repeat protein [Corynebacteriales bacterium]|nr:DUF4097 family beta strand repeat protein [Mycobacteriales bacterium]
MKINRPMWITFGGVLTVAVLAIGVAGAWIGLFADTNDIDRTERSTYSRAISALDIDLEAGDVSVRTSPGREVAVSRHIVWNGDTKPQFKEVFVGDRLEITAGDCDGAFDNCSIDYEIEVPEDVRVTIRTSGGDVETDSVRDVGTIHTSGGDVSVIGSAESLRANTSGGDISIVSAQGSVNAESAGGDIELDFVSPPISARAKSSGGDVEVALPAGGDYRVDGRADGGHVGISVRESAVPTSVISAHTSGGDVDVHYR